MLKRSALAAMIVSVPGLFVLAALDSTFFFTLPLGIDAAIVLVVARHLASPWAATLYATSGSLIGAAFTFWTGAEAGDLGVGRFIHASWMARIKRRMDRGSAVAIALLDLIPPPFPFSLFVLAAGAFKMSVRRFFVTLALCRLLRFGVEALLGAMYGKQVLQWLGSDLIREVVWIWVALALGLTIVSIGRLVHSEQSHRRAARA